MNQKQLELKLSSLCPKNPEACTDQEIYQALLALTQSLAGEKQEKKGKKKLYYISAEFLMGKLLSNNLINLGIYSDIQEILERSGKSLSALEELEAEPSLGNGGLGRLAACFLDSIATLGLNGDGVGLNYHFGLFRQKFVHNLQQEEPDPWIETPSWLKKTDVTYQIPYRGFTLTSRMYDVQVTGYHSRTNTLHLFDVETIQEDLVKEGISFDKTDIRENLTLFLYPDDSDRAGRILRIYQQYFMCANAARLILDEAVSRGSSLHDLAEYAVIQINDTHPSMIIPELIRLLTAEHDFEMDEAIQVVSSICAYTNHTILAEALETWPMDFFKEAVPQLIPIMEILDDKVRRKFDDPSVYLIDREDRVHMAHMDIHYGFSVNGVAALHTEILKNDTLHNFYQLYPEKFNNKTNGITFRRWLLYSNPELSDFISSLIGEEWKKDASHLQKLDRPEFLKNAKTLSRLLAIKDLKKRQLAQYLQENCHLTVNPDSIFDIQVKRLHEYKRQQMNLLYLIHKYLEIREGKLPTTPITAIFGAKAAPAYTIAKDIIHAILCLQQIIQEDPRVRPWLNVVMVPNYNVTLAEKLIPACDLSEQISLASKEASGTGNMKFMLNGAVTLGTEDGANVEIHHLVGDSNIYIFGDSSQTVIERYRQGSYRSKEYYENDPVIRQAVDFLTGPQMMAAGCRENLERLSGELLNKDWFMTFPDFQSYLKAREQAFLDYENRTAWAQKMLVNISQAGFFSSDRTIEEYNRDIWKLD
ncbi:MAG TPA: glycogen/starch/alpha-glucan family phosphorylase [Candidatus Enterocloster excrementigallinarum]|uniref:Alpha-1,4 glucan phosphorylase n=1 Tax=Candidatus Enterocloster excrementigallinarum TaxID=2838558 RepID=A0A9D2TFD5_9FIRM|nr:glycogen/starch/alpha-glucan family phosphorylase [Candidatus Enterocloster excrementigallinarum]